MKRFLGLLFFYVMLAVLLLPLAVTLLLGGAVVGYSFSEKE